MSFYDQLKNSEQPKTLTPVEEIRANYERDLNYLFGYVLQQCNHLNQQGIRQFTAYTKIYRNSDNQQYMMRWTTGSPEVMLQSMQSSWTRSMDAVKGSAPFEIRNDRNALFAFAVNWHFPDQSKELRDKFLRDLRQRFTAEGFPADCVTAVDVPIVLPTAFSFWSGKATDFTQACICYHVKFSANW